MSHLSFAVFFILSARALGHGNCSSSSCLGTSLLQLKKDAGGTKVQLSDEEADQTDSDQRDSPREMLVRSLAEHWLRVVEERVVPQAKLLSCAHLPTEILEYFNGIDKLSSVCTSDGGPGQRIPSKRDLSFYMRFVEAPCTAQEPRLNTSHMVDCIFSTAAQAPADVDAWDNFNWDNLAAFEQKHAAQLEGVADICAQLFGDSGECSVSLAQSHARASQRTERRVDKVQWLTRPVEHPLAKSMGYVHSLLELEAEGNRYELEVFPGAGGTQVSARHADQASDDSSRVHFEVSGKALKSDLSVSDILDELKANSKSYDLIHNNCHTMIQKTLQQVTAPGMHIPDSPNSKWEAMAAKLDRSAPTALELFLQTSGASRLGCSAHHG